MSARFAYRPELDGLRGVAVAVVFVYHAAPDLLQGGFLGVDVFFTLSGFLITSLLLLEHDQSGRIDVRAFWLRRARRLLPASLLLLGSVAIVEGVRSDLITTTVARRDELVSTLFYVANWFSIATERSYFAQYVDASPVRHAWSLAIEEQFYMVFPLVILFGFKRIGRTKLAWVLAAASAVSAVAMAVTFDPASPSRAYYGTDTRVHQLLIGVLLAFVLHGRHGDRTAEVARLLTPISAVGLVLAFALVSDQSRFYYSGGSLGVAIVTALLIVGVTGHGHVRRALSWGPLVWLGGISYGVYLWHWPLLLWIGHGRGAGDVSLMRALGVAVATLMVAWLSFVLVERPVRTGALARMNLRPVVMWISSAAAVLVVFALIRVALPGERPAWAGGGRVPVVSNLESPVDEAADEIADEIADEASDEIAADEPAIPRTMAFVGDSVMASSAPGFRLWAAEQGWSLIEGAVPACPVGSGDLYSDTGDISPYAAACAESVPQVHQAVIDGRPSLVYWHDLQSVLSRRDESGALLVSGTAEWESATVAAWVDALDRFTANGAHVVVLNPPLRSEQALGCPGQYAVERCREIERQDATIRSATAAFGRATGGRTDVSFIDIDAILCEAYPCPAMLDGIAVREGGYDLTHFTEQGAIWFVDRLFDLAPPGTEVTGPSSIDRNVVSAASRP